MACSQRMIEGAGKPIYNKCKDEDVAFVKQHIDMFPVMESHYCRKNTKRLYLDFKLSITKMCFLYKEYCTENNRTPVTHSMYRKIFCTSFNLSYFIPKKDQCSFCNKYSEAKKTGTLNERIKSDYNKHMDRKNEANLAKEADKARSNEDSTFMSATFDLQSVLQIPSGAESLLYYCRKLCIYNLCIYESRLPNEAFCILWSEINGKRGSNEIGTTLMQWISKLPENIKEISLFSDTCGGQNRNQHISALLLFLTQTTHIDVIEQKFLESGHSFMEVDSMHSAIEREKRHASINSVLEWINIMQKARSNRNKKTANPYHVNQLKYSDVFDLKDLSKRMIKNRLKDENGNVVKWLQIKCLRYEKQNPGIIKYRYSHSGSYNILKVFKRGRQNKTAGIKKAYNEPLPISVPKKQDLLKLCRKNIIPKELHPTANNVSDHTVEPAQQDEEQEEEDGDESK